MERKIGKNYEIPEDELRRIIIEKIPKIRPIEKEKPKGFKEFFISALTPKACEVCGENGYVHQCPYCGRWVGVKAQYVDPGNILKMRWYHENCFNSQFGCCKICANFIKEKSTKISCAYCGTTFYKFEERCPYCGAPIKC